MIFAEKPSGFKNKFDIVSCFCIKEDKFLFLHRQNHKPQGNTWGVPAGKADPGEDLTNAIQRELKEETGLTVTKKEIRYLGKVYTRYPDYDFTFHMYKTIIKGNAKVTINPKEHKDFKWVAQTSLSKLALMEDIEECIKLFYIEP